MTKSQIRRLKTACYTTNISMSVVGNLSPVLFLTFRTLYGISYSLLGLLVLINFVTQLTIDLLFSFFSHKFNIPKAVKMTPVLTLIGLSIYALWPFLLPDHVYIGLVIGTLIFSRRVFSGLKRTSVPLPSGRNRKPSVVRSVRPKFSSSVISYSG